MLKYKRMGLIFTAALMAVCFCAPGRQAAAAGAPDAEWEGDADYDRLPDAWEIAYGLNPHMPDGNADADGDGFSNYAEYAAHSDPVDPWSAPLIVHDTIPPQHTGISKRAPVSRTASLGVLISSTFGIDLTHPDSIRFSIDDELLPIYARDLSADSVRVVKLNDAEDSRATLLWAVYDRSREVDIPAAYSPDAFISIGVGVRDGLGNVLAAGEFNFRIESERASAETAGSLPQTAPVDPSDPLLEGEYDRGIQVVDGPLEGAKIIYSSREPHPPVFGPVQEFAGVDADGVEAVGFPLNLEPHTVFDTPVKIYIPIPDDVQAESLGVYFHNGLQWQPGCDPAGDVSDAGMGWMRPESRVILNDQDPALIGIDVHHFSGVQTVIFARFSGDRDDDNIHDSNSGNVYVSCFITSASSQRSPCLRRNSWPSFF